MSARRTAYLDQLEAAYAETYQDHDLDLHGREDDDLIALRSARLTLRLVASRWEAHGNPGDAIAEAQEILERMMFPEHLGFLG